jgi:pyruvate dehydrogenase phosphatase
MDLPEDLAEGDGRRFLIMATDGLWDRISSEHAVALVGAWLDGERGARPLSAVMEHAHPVAKSLGSGYHPSPNVKQTRATFEDANAATHLIRCAGSASRRLRL